jgi:hypothetical protein
MAEDVVTNVSYRRLLQTLIFVKPGYYAHSFMEPDAGGKR